MNLNQLIVVFYAGLVLLEFDNRIQFDRWARSVCVGDYEIYNGAYAYLSKEKPQWYRLDLTPVLLEEVPKELRTLALLMT